MPINRDASFVENLAPNMAAMFLDRVAKSSSREAFRYPKGETWESVTWKQVGDRVTSLAAGLLSLGLQEEQRVGIASGDVRGTVRRRFHTLVDASGLDEDRARDWVVVRMVHNAMWEIHDHPDAPDPDWLTCCVAVAKAVQG